MNVNDSQLATFDAAAEGRLRPSEQAAFEATLSANADLRRAWDDYRRFRHSLESVHTKRQLTALHENLLANGALTDTAPDVAEARVQPLHTGRSWRWVTAAVVAVLLGIWLWPKQGRLPQQTQQLYADLYRPEPAIRGGGNCVSTPMQAIVHYRAGQYQAALSQLPAVATDACTAYYRGLCLLALNKPKQAVEALLAVQPYGTGSLKQRADWYLSLAYLANNDPDHARQQWQQITSQPGHPFGPVAGQALA